MTLEVFKFDKSGIHSNELHPPNIRLILVQWGTTKDKGEFFFERFSLLYLKSEIFKFVSLFKENNELYDGLFLFSFIYAS